MTDTSDNDPTVEVTVPPDTAVVYETSSDDPAVTPDDDDAEVDDEPDEPDDTPVDE